MDEGWSVNCPSGASGIGGTEAQATRGSLQATIEIKF